MSSDPDKWFIPDVADLEAARKGYNLSCRELSRLAGLSEGHWARIVNEDYDPHLSTVRAVADALRDADPNGAKPSGRPPCISASGSQTDDSDRDVREARR